MSETILGAKELMRYYREQDIPAYLHGAPGVGKSDACRQLAEEAKVGFVDIRVSQMLPEDINGIPVPDLEKRLAVWLGSEMFPQYERDGREGIIIFDELSDASRNIQSACHKVILDRQGIPKGWWPCAAGNRRQDKASALGLSTALANRFAHIDVEPDPESWVLWANANDIHHLVVGFIRFRTNMLHNMEGADLRAFPTPRAWARVSKLCETPRNVRYRLIMGLVGEGAAGEFEAFLKTIDLPELDEILADPKKCRIPKEPASRYACSSMLARYADRANFEKILVYASREQFGRDFEISLVLDATKRDSSLTETKTFVSFANRNSDLSL